MKNILMITHQFPIDRRILYQIESLEQNNYQVQLLVLGYSPEKEFFLDIFLRKLYVFLRNHMCSYVHLWKLMRGIIFSIKNPALYYKKKLFPANLAVRYDIYVAHDLPTLPLAAELAKYHNSSLVYDSHEFFTGQGLNFLENRGWKKIERKFISQCQTIITINESIKSLFVTKYNVQNVQVIYNAEKKYSLKGRKIFHEVYGFSENTKIVLLQGSLTPERNFAILVNAMEFTDPNIKLIFLGDGPEKYCLEKLSKSKGFSDKVYFHQSVEQNLLLDYTASADLGIITYTGSCINNYYCTPNKLFEYIAAQIPIIANDLPELKRFVEGHQIGMVYPFTSAMKVANLINLALTPANYQLFKNNLAGLQLAISWENESKTLINIYNCL